MAWLAYVRIALFFDTEARSVSGVSALVYSWFGIISFSFHMYNVTFEATAWPYLAALLSGLFIAFTQFYSLVKNLVSVSESEDRHDDA